MPKFEPARFPPGFFDLPADAGEVLPLAVIEQWTASAATREAALEILGPYTRRGMVVSSDASGLTKLSRERPLVEILALINRPKELIHAFGRAVGGHALGVWAADNTQMLYPEELGAERVLAMLRATQQRLREEATVGIGLCAHAGTFYELQGGVYGPDADRVEAVAEEHTEPGELLVTADVMARLGDGHGFLLTPRGDLDAAFGAIYRVEGGPELSGLELTDYRYPAPFDDGFYEELRSWSDEQPTALPRPAYEDRAVVLVERERDVPDLPEVALLNDLALSAAMKRIAGELLAAHDGLEIKTSGLYGIYVFADTAVAVAFAQAFRAAFAAQRVQTRIGVDAGQVLLFDLGRGRRDIAGSPVNVASKLAQDIGDFGKIYLSEEATRRARMQRQSRTATFAVSGVELTAREL